MVQSLKLGGAPNAETTSMRRVNRLPLIVVVVLVVLFLVVIFYGLTSRGLYLSDGSELYETSGDPASTHADDLKRGVGDGIIGEPVKPSYQPTPVARTEEPSPEPITPTPVQRDLEKGSELEPEQIWRARLEREQREQFLREGHRQKMARLQADDAAYDAPIAIDRGKFEASDGVSPSSEVDERGGTTGARSSSDLYAAALRAGLGGQNLDANNQQGKEQFLNSDIKEPGHLPNQVMPQLSPYELKRGSVIPATLITGVNSDLPGRIAAQVSQNVYDTATGYRLLIPQGTKLFGRYDSKIAFGQSRVLVIWTDLIFPNGSALQIGGMAGTDAQGHGGFKDTVNKHYLRTFGSAILLAVIGTGMDMAIPESSTLATQDTASDAARRNFAETFGRVTERTINKNLEVQPTINIRPGYKFNVLVDQDMMFAGPYRSIVR